MIVKYRKEENQVQGEILVSNSDKNLGGRDLDCMIAKKVLKEHLQDNGTEFEDCTPQTRQPVLLACEKARKALSNQNKTTIHLENIEITD